MMESARSDTVELIRHDMKIVRPGVATVEKGNVTYVISFGRSTLEKCQKVLDSIPPEKNNASVMLITHQVKTLPPTKGTEIIRPPRVMRGGHVHFGIKEDRDGVSAIILPMFSLEGCRMNRLEKAITEINNTPPFYRNTPYERELGEMILDGAQIIICDGRLIALTQQAASALLALRLRMTKDYFYVPIQRRISTILQQGNGLS